MGSNVDKVKSLASKKRKQKSAMRPAPALLPESVRALQTAIKNSRMRKKRKCREKVAAVPPPVLVVPKKVRKVPAATPAPKQVNTLPLLVPKSCYPIDTKGLCILCYRERFHMNVKRASKNKRLEFSTKFCTLLLRHLKLDLQRNIFQAAGATPRFKKCTKVGVVLCEDCSLLARTFCDLYSQLELVRMQMDACVKSISDIVRIAGKIPSRVKTYEERMGSQEEETVGVTVTTVVDKKKRREKGVEPVKIPRKKKKTAIAIAKTFRQELLRKSIRSQNSTVPRVILERIGNEGCKESQSACPTFPAVPKQKPPFVFQQLQQFTMAYAFTLASVWSLSTLGRKESDVKLEKSSIVVPFKPSPNVFKKPQTQATKAVVPIPTTITVPRVIVNPTPSTSAAEGGDLTDSVNNKESQQEDPNQKRNAFTITDFGKTVLLPHQVFKIDNTFVDESLMDYEESCDFIDLAEENDGLFPTEVVILPGSTSDVEKTIPMQTDDVMPIIPVKTEFEPTEVTINLNDRHCKDCNIHLSCRAELEKHRVFIHKLLCYVECPVCKQVFSGYTFLARHRTLSEQCEISGVDEIREYETIAKPIFPHISSVRGDKFCPMEGCFEVFGRDEHLTLHLKTHGSFSCSFCRDHKIFEKAHDLALHEAEEHFGSNSSFGYKCSRCEFHVGSQYSFLLHFLDVHLKIDVFKERCEICQKGFSSRNPENKEVHFKTHHDIQGKAPASVFICEICQAPFLRRSQLNEHEVHIHHLNNGKKFICNICGQELISTMILEKHKLSVHNNLSLYEVEAQWKRKMKQQQGARPKNFHCGCGKTFSSNFALKSHVKNIHNGVQPPCQENQNEQGKNPDNQGQREKSRISATNSQEGPDSVELVE